MASHVGTHAKKHMLAYMMIRFRRILGLLFRSMHVYSAHFDNTSAGRSPPGRGSNAGCFTLVDVASTTAFVTSSYEVQHTSGSLLVHNGRKATGASASHLLGRGCAYSMSGHPNDSDHTARIG
ncbi:unnamed protein product [Protopolystoma xenopodis]|uniref:Uncharacterized protein n=1 Tax=Protopolystoma xenopodis TaxID=117903 RepID=A0A3S5CKI2_9PLAT|nr:unnamed protein product [Protopolystoma xenopodis]